VLVLGVVALVALVVGAGVALIAWRWPSADPTSPTVEPVAGKDGSDGVTILGVSAAAVAVLVCISLFGFLFVLVQTHTGFARMDLGPAQWAAHHATSVTTTVLRVVTALPLVAVLGVVEHRRRPNRSILLFLLLVEGGQVLLANLVKVLVGRERPDIDRLMSVAQFSFPSGHTTTAAATYAALALLLGRGRSHHVRVALAGTAAGVTALVAGSRVLLGVHWVTDVLAGAALGWGWAAVCSIAFGGRLLRFGAPLEHGTGGKGDPVDARAEDLPSGGDGRGERLRPGR